ncbi:hypothetical protein RTBOTA2_005670 [Rhodotorula toruloides]|nr:hypothetical protein RTBOTA2_005670 [Rhodotorula toruloides]
MHRNALATMVNDFEPIHHDRTFNFFSLWARQSRQGRRSVGECGDEHVGGKGTQREVDVLEGGRIAEEGRQGRGRHALTIADAPLILLLMLVELTLRKGDEEAT